MIKSIVLKVFHFKDLANQINLNLNNKLILIYLSSDKKRKSDVDEHKELSSSKRQKKKHKKEKKSNHSKSSKESENKSNKKK